MAINIERSNRSLILLAAFLMALAVIIGAFGAHGLEGKISEKAMNTFQTGSRYHIYHSLGLLIVTIIGELSGIKFRATTICFIIGILLFSGNCYLYAITGFKVFAMLVPIGGLSYIIGWFLLAFKMLRSER